MPRQSTTRARPSWRASQAAPARLARFEPTLLCGKGSVTTNPVSDGMVRDFQIKRRGTLQPLTEPGPGIRTTRFPRNVHVIRTRALARAGRSFLGRGALNSGSSGNVQCDVTGDSAVDCIAR